MKIKLNKIKYSWQFNILNIDNYNNSNSSLIEYYNFIRKYHNKIPGDLLEAGVHKGKSLLATALLLKELGSKKKIYAFDSWSGFPKKYKYDKNDKIKLWDKMYETKQISKSHFEMIKLNLSYLSFLKKQKINNINSFNISTSSNFSDAPLNELKRKIKFLQLNNIVLVPGSFEKTMTKKNYKKLMCGLVDVDLYESYKITLPFIWKNLEKKGMIYLDEYFSLKFPGGKIASDEFFKSKKDKPIKLATKDGFQRWAVIKTRY